MNKEQLIKEYDEKAKALRDAFISKLKDDKKEFELTYPSNGEIVYYINGIYLKVYDLAYYKIDNEARNMFEHGYIYYTREEAEHYLKERKLLFKIHQWAKEKNEGWEPDWSNEDEEKYFITHYSYESSGEFSWEITWGVHKFNKLPYFKSSEIVQECIDIFGDEIKEVLVDGK